LAQAGGHVSCNSNKENPEKFDTMENTWKSCLKDSSKYKIISPKELLANIDNTDLKNYLEKRYW